MSEGTGTLMTRMEPGKKQLEGLNSAFRLQLDLYNLKTDWNLHELASQELPENIKVMNPSQLLSAEVRGVSYQEYIEILLQVSDALEE